MDSKIGTPWKHNIQANAIILSGGAGKRFGGKEKAFLSDGNKTIIKKKIDLLKPLVEKIIIVTNQPDLYKNLDAEIVMDKKRGIGPLMGLYCGLKASSKKINFVTTSDTPFIFSELIEYLLTQCSAFDAVVPVGRSGLEPLCAVYSKKCIPAIRKMMPKRQIRAFYQDIKINYISKEVIHEIDPEELSFFNINTENDYRKFLLLSTKK